MRRLPAEAQHLRREHIVHTDCGKRLALEDHIGGPRGPLRVSLVSLPSVPKFSPTVSGDRERERLRECWTVDNVSRPWTWWTWWT